jgi:hypothetical protein
MHHRWLIFWMNGEFFNALNQSAWLSGRLDKSATDEDLIDFDMAWCGGGPL